MIKRNTIFKIINNTDNCINNYEYNYYARILKAYSHSHSTSGASVSVSATRSALNEYSFTLNEWEATLALGPFTNGTHSQNRGRV